MGVSANAPRVVTNDLATGTWDDATREIRILSVTSTDLDFTVRDVDTGGSDIFVLLRRPGDGEILGLGEIRALKDKDDYDDHRDDYMDLLEGD